MHPTSILVLLGLALPATAAPVPDITARAAAGGTNVNGSIYAFGSPAACRQAFYNSGACGLSARRKNVDPKISLIALPSAIFDKAASSAQAGSLCGRVITMKRNGVKRKAMVADRNQGPDNSIDMCLDLWQAFGGRDRDGTLLRGFSWEVSQ
ncbi:hypothetical protein NOR_04282 [Metarhizium rileyi]|uniref:Barwin-like endoglucanase n=1 Tax=Metarhizium rileyi (strain RCEF 4871) TaxID=1649241 RepID=A0A167ECZ8_METRR|nr:hypothetical protein NOR_04282 [Metarhizium rileyi RCEF 4871]TWU78569.1 hypothetical protein ED733_003664 [Metarhizium rileyi]